MSDAPRKDPSGSSGVTRFVMKTAGGTFLIRLFYLASGFAMTLLLIKWLGANGLGVYNYVVSWVALAVIFVKFGFEDFLVRETAALQAKGNVETAQKLWRFSRRFVLSAGFLVVLCFSAALWFLDFENETLKPTFWIGLLMIPLLGVIGLYRGRFRANKRVVNSQIPEFLIRPSLMVLTICLLLWLGVAKLPQYAIIINVGATVTALVFCMVSDWWLFSSPNGSAEITSPFDPEKQPAVVLEKPDSSWSYWIAGAVPFVMIAGIHIINQRADRLMLGGMIDMDAVGYYSVAAQMAMVVNFTLLGINQAIGPLVAERYESKRSGELEKTLVRATLIATIGSFAIVICLMLFGRWVLSFFDPEFQQSYIPMLILALGQLANVAAGPAGSILAMSNNEKLVGMGILISAIVNLVLNAILIPNLGIIGASVATAVSMATWNILLVVFAKRILGINANMWAFLVPGKSTT